MNFKTIPAAITVPQGFRSAGVYGDLKRLGTGKGSNKGRKRDLALVASDLPAAVAGMFTTNQVCAAPVRVSVARARQAFAQAIVLNSGNANACTGETGLRDARRMTELVAELLELSPRQVLVCSTGRIGVPLPMKHVERAIRSAVAELSPDARSGHHAAEAILTSDTRPKEAAVELVLGGQTVRLAGMCKGAGMIQPGMSLTGARPAARPLHATMLACLTTDAAVESRALKAALAEAVANSFNRITVDGDMSTNDSVILLANGRAHNPLITLSPRTRSLYAQFQEALNHVTLALAKMIVQDGEGVSRLITVRVEGARSFAEADAAARAVANSALVKTSWFGGDPNWGRILCALGYSPARVEEDRLDVAYSAPGSQKRVYALKNGRPTAVPFARLCAAVAPREFDLHIHLHAGKGQAVVYTCDLTEEYVDFNKGSVSDPSAMGG